MYSVSEAFLAALRQNHTAIARVDLLRSGDVIESNIPVLTGDVNADSQALIRRRCDISLPGTEEVLALLPQEFPSNGGLWPLGNELKLYSGIRYPDGTEEMASMGVFRISRPVANEASLGERVVTVSGYDRSRSVSRAKFTHPYVITQGTNYSIAIKNLVQSRLPWLADDQFLFMDTNYTTPELVFVMDDDPWDMAVKMAESLGAELFFDGDGNCVMRPEPDPAFTPSSFDYIAGEDATISTVTRDLDDEQAYNGVIVTGENSDLPAPVRAEAWDINPDSPTYFDPDYPEASQYGAVPYFISSQYITTQGQAQDAADANLLRVMGIIEKIEFSAINNPAHEAGDVISVGRPELNVSGVYILDSVRMGLGPEASMSGTTRKRRAT